MPEDCAVVGVGQLEVLGRGRRGEADHLNISPVNMLSGHLEYLLKEKLECDCPPCQGR